MEAWAAIIGLRGLPVAQPEIAELMMDSGANPWDSSHGRMPVWRSSAEFRGRDTGIGRIPGEKG